MKSREAAAFPCLLCHITVSFASFIMSCSSVTLLGNHAHCVLQRVNHRAQVFARCLLQARQIQNQTASECTGHGARKHSTRRVLSGLPVAICLKSGNRRLHPFQRIVMVTVVLFPLTICASLYCFSAFKISLFYPSVMKKCIRSRLLFTLIFAQIISFSSTISTRTQNLPDSSVFPKLSGIFNYRLLPLLVERSVTS